MLATQVAANNPQLAGGVDCFIHDMDRRRETRSILSKGTLLRFQQIWLHRSFEMGVSVDPHVEVIDGPLQGKWVCFYFLAECDAYRNPRCHLNPEYLEPVAK
jgi:hypothetical protein